MTTETQAPEGGQAEREAFVRWSFMKGDIPASEAQARFIDGDDNAFHPERLAEWHAWQARAAFAAQPQEPAMRAEHLDERDHLINARPDKPGLPTATPAEGGELRAAAAKLVRAVQRDFPNTASCRANALAAADKVQMILASHAQPKGAAPVGWISWSEDGKHGLAFRGTERPANLGDEDLQLVFAGPAQAPAPVDGDVRELRKWLNEQPNRPVDRDALARLLHAVENAQPVGEIVTDCDGEAVLGDEVSWRVGMPPAGTKLYAAPCAAVAPEPSAQDLVNNACLLSVWWTHNRAKFTTPRQAAFAAWNERFRAFHVPVHGGQP